MKRSVRALIAVLTAACTDPGSDPNAVIAIRPEPSPYPSIVEGDSLRDSLGTLQPVRVTGLNYKGEPVAGATFVFSSPDTSLRIFENGVVFARNKKVDGTRAPVFATNGSLQAKADSLFIVSRPDSIDADSATRTRPPNATLVPDSISFTVRVSGANGAAATPAPNWLVSFQLRLHDKLLAPTDTTAVYTFSATGSANTDRPVRGFLDTTSASGTVSRGLKINCSALVTGSDSVIVIATMRDRRPGTRPKSAQTVVRLERTTCP